METSYYAKWREVHREEQREYFKKHYRKNKAKKLAYAHNLYRKNAAKIAANKREYYKKNRERILESRKLRSIHSAEKRSANSAVQQALLMGKLIRPSKCRKCGVKCKPDAHHKNYKFRLKVQWLCRRCHLRTHRS